MERGVPVRAISRGFSVLSAISRDGPITLMDISRKAEVPYATACRIVQTLLHEGLIDREPGRKRYRVTSLVLSLATGFQDEDFLAAEALPFMEDLTRKIGWPVSLCTRVGTRMVVRAATHQMTTLTFTNYYPGFTLPISESAAGKAYLAHCSDEERGMINDAWEATDNEAAQAGMLLMCDDVALQNIRDSGYALQIRNKQNNEPGKTSAISVPLIGADGQLKGALVLIYFASAITPTEAPARFLGELNQLSASISRAIGTKSIN